MPVTFQVSDVTPNTEPCYDEKWLLTVPQAVEKLVRHQPEASGANSADPLLPMGIKNGLVSAVHASFSHHMPLVLSPDDIWLAIAQGFAAHVNAHVEELRKHFVAHQGKVHIEIQRDHFVKGSAANDWPGCFAEFSDRIGEYIGKKRDLLVSSFSTTGVIEKAASEVVLMDAMSAYFSYGVSTACGIPSVTLLGTVADWEQVRTRAAVLAEFECKPWVEALLPVLDQFVAAAKGRADTTFWQSFYKYRSGSGSSDVSGWINTFFPYLHKGRPNPACGGDPRRGIDTDQYPVGLSSVPFTWSYGGSSLSMLFLGGFVGATQVPDGEVRPVTGWAVSEAAIERATMSRSSRSKLPR